MAKCIVIGRGNIGQALMGRLEAEGHQVACSVNTRLTGGLFIGNDRVQALSFEPGDDFKTNVFKALDNIVAKDPKVDIAFLAISTRDQGQSALAYIEYFLSKGVPVVTCEKGALAFHFGKLAPHLHRIGFTAAVGGGSRILPYLQLFDFSHGAWFVDGVVNGTLNYIWSGLNNGRAFATLVAEARRLGYAEPDGEDDLGLVKGEIDDVTKKASVLFNRTFADKGGPFLDPTMFERGGDMDLDDLQMLTDDYENRRYVVTFTNVWNEKLHRGAVEAGSRTAACGDWRIRSAFVPARKWLPSGVDNCIRIQNGANGPYRVEGPGAGAVPTVGAMMYDMQRLLRA